MTAQQQTLLLFGGIAAVLVLASATGCVLQRRSGPTPVIENLNARIKAWWVMVALIGVAFIAGKPGVIILFAIASFAALREFVTLTYTRRGDHWAILASFFLVLPLQYYLIWIEWYGLYSIFIPVYAFLLLPIVAALRGDTTRFLERVAQVQWGLMIAVFCVSHVPALLTLDITGYTAAFPAEVGTGSAQGNATNEGTSRNLLLIAFLVLVVQGSDVLQYVWGKLAGRRKVAPALSPSKTWEGLIGGVASASLIGAALWWITPFTPWQAGAMAFVICLMGFFGGLVMSAIKRDRGVKDWGRMIEGHGGMLDRLDSVIFAAPVFFHLTRFWFAN